MHAFAPASSVSEKKTTFFKQMINKNRNIVTTHVHIRQGHADLALLYMRAINCPSGLSLTSMHKAGMNSVRLNTQKTNEIIYLKKNNLF